MATALPEAGVSPSETRRRPGVLGWFVARPGVLALAGLWLLFVANFVPFGLPGPDAQRPFTFVRALFGEGKTSDAYQFGLALFEVPFYGIARLLSLAGIERLHGMLVGPGMIAVGMALLVLAAVLIMVPVLERLRLPTPALTLGLALFGSPLFFYGAFSPGQTHAVDTLLFTAVVGVLLVYFRAERPSPALPALLGGLIALSTTVRYFTVAEGLALALGLLWYRRWRDAAIFVAAGLAIAVLLGLVPQLVAGNALGGAGGGDSKGLGPALSVLTFAPLNPLRMLFTPWRGLFLWTPVTVLAVVGYARLLLRQREDRQFLAVAGAAGIAVLLSYAFSPWWMGFGFSQRYLTSLFPLFAIGIGSLLQWRPRLVLLGAGLAVAWTVWLGAYAAFKFGYDDRRSDAFESTVRLTTGKIRPGLVLYDIYCGSRARQLLPRFRTCGDLIPVPHSVEESIRLARRVRGSSSG